MHELLKINTAKETERIVTRIKNVVVNKLKKRGIIIGISGGLDSSVVLALAVKAVGPTRVIGIMMPEIDSSSESKTLAQSFSEKLSVQTYVEEMGPGLRGLGCYQRRNDAIQHIFPDFTRDFVVKITLAKNTYEKDSLNYFNITVISPDGHEQQKRLPLAEYLKIVAASNFKQRSRMAMLYYHAEMRNYAVNSTANKNEHDMGFLVKFGDGAGDMFPLKHLFKTQVYQLAEYLNIPEEIRNRVPTSDTYSAEQTQQEFFFGLPFEVLDPVWAAWEAGWPAEKIAPTVNLSATQVENIIKDIQRKIKATEYLRMQPLGIEE